MLVTSYEQILSQEDGRAEGLIVQAGSGCPQHALPAD